MKLNLCCGANVFPGWLNVDRTDVEADYLSHLRRADPNFRWPPEQQALVDRISEIQFIRHDVRQGLDCFNMPDGSQLQVPDGSVEAIYVGQAIEHFNRRTEAPAFLRECLRVLRQYGVIKLTTPSLLALLSEWDNDSLDDFSKDQPAFYVDAEADDQLCYLLFGASGADCTSQNYEGHFHCYTLESLGRLLMECGFDCRTHNSPEFADCIDKGMSHSFAIEGVKP